MNHVAIVRSGMQLQSVGFKNESRNQLEIQIEVNTVHLLPAAEELLLFVLDYAGQCDRPVLPEETLAYDYWLLRFRENNGVLDIWEYNPSATEFIKGGSLVLTYWRDQHRTCESFHTVFTPAIANKLTVIDEGVLNGLPVQGVRYPSPDHMTGWWITSDKYNGDIATLRPQHTYHVTAARPELASYLALPYGFRFSVTTEHSDAWFDQQVALPSD